LSGVLGWIDADHDGMFASEFASEWESLANRVGAPPWARPQWTSIWWQAFGSGQLTVFYVRRGTTVVGVAPMVHGRRAVSSPTNYHSPGYTFVALDDAAAVSLATAVVGRARPAVVSFLDSDGLTVRSLVAEARRKRLPALTRTLEHPPCVETVGDWATYESNRDSKLLRDLRRRERRLAEEGASLFSIESGESNLAELLADCFATEAASWKGAAGTAMNSTPATQFFYSEVARHAASRGELMLAFLRLSGKPIATQLSINFGDTVTVLKLGHDEAFSRFAPGKLLVRHVLRECFAGPTTCFDFSGHANPYKMEWADQTRSLVETRTYPRSVTGATAWASRRYARPMAKRLLARARS
jgi:CelD/BcsL family acetyltransferase involved in cellulose biosynthesis